MIKYIIKVVPPEKDLVKYWGGDAGPFYLLRVGKMIKDIESAHLYAEKNVKEAAQCQFSLTGADIYLIEVECTPGKETKWK